MGTDTVLALHTSDPTATSSLPTRPGQLLSNLPAEHVLPQAVFVGLQHCILSGAPRGTASLPASLPVHPEGNVSLPSVLGTSREEL